MPFMVFGMLILSNVFAVYSFLFDMTNKQMDLADILGDNTDEKRGGAKYSKVIIG